MKNKNFYNIIENKNEVNIYIYGVIGGLNSDNRLENTAKSFKKEFENIDDSVEIVNIHINSVGGSVHEGLPIFNTIKNSKKTIHTYVDGIAYSMGAIIALAGDKLHIFENSLMMFHNASSFSFGNSFNFQKESEILKKYDNSLATVLMSKLNITKDEVMNEYFNGEDNLFNSDELIKRGIADVLISKNSENIPNNIKNLSHKDLLNFYSKMNNDQNEEKITKNKIIMSQVKDYPQIKKILNIEDNLESKNNKDFYLNAAQIVSIENEIESIKKENENLKLDIENSNDLNKKILDKLNSKIENKVDDLEKGVDLLISKNEKLGKEDASSHTDLDINVSQEKQDNSITDLNKDFYSKINNLTN